MSAGRAARGDGPAGRAAQAARAVNRARKLARKVSFGASTVLEVKLLLIAAVLVVVFVLLVLVALILIGGMASAQQGQMTCTASQQGKAAIPARLMPIYEAAAAERDNPKQKPLGDRGVWILAAINSVETSFGANKNTSSAGATGPMQFMPGTWAAYGVDADGDGQRNIRDPEDAIHAAAKYLRASGAPDNWYRAIFAYNHSDAYVREVETLADAYQGTCAFAGGSGPLGGVQRVAASGPHLAPVPGTGARCDRRIVQNVVYLIQRFRLRLGDCHALSGHSSDGEHPLGLAVDVTPADGNWNNTMAAARFVGWKESCARQGCPNPLARWIGYNGVADHGDPQHCSGGCPPHLHISWNHAPAAFNSQAAWVDVWKLPGGGGA